MTTLLIIDDSPTERVVLISIIKRNFPEYMIYEANDGEEGVAMAEKLTPDIVLMDIVMPGMNGLQAARALNQRGLAGKIIMVTTKDDPKDITWASRMGADAYLRKPIIEDELVTEINKQITILENEETITNSNISERDDAEELEHKELSRRLVHLKRNILEKENEIQLLNEKICELEQNHSTSEKFRIVISLIVFIFTCALSALLGHYKILTSDYVLVAFPILAMILSAINWHKVHKISASMSNGGANVEIQ